MADRGKPLDETTRRLILRYARHLPIKQVAREAGVDRNTARKYLRQAKAA